MELHHHGALRTGHLQFRLTIGLAVAIPLRILGSTSNTVVVEPDAEQGV